MPMMFSIKEGVSLKKLQPQMFVALLAAYDVYQEFGVPLVITAGDDGEHMPGSKHYQGLALDLRSRDFVVPGEKEKALKMIQIALGKQYDFLQESDHFHVEFDPKN